MQDLGWNSEKQILGATQWNEGGIQESVIYVFVINFFLLEMICILMFSLAFLFRQFLVPKVRHKWFASFMLEDNL
jgi:hypothetical protein